MYVPKKYRQELLEFARKTLEAAEKNGDIFKPAGGGRDAGDDEEQPAASKKAKANAPQPLVGELGPIFR